MVSTKSIMLFLIPLLAIQYPVNAQFTGQGGVYYLGGADVPVSTSAFSNPDISGVVVRFRWNTVETSPGNFNWTFVDGEIAKAILYHKKISLQPLGIPEWMDSLGVQQFYFIDENPLHATYGQIVSGLLTWDTIYVNRYKYFLQAMAGKYAADTNVSYVNAVAVAISRNLPDTVVTDTTLMTQQPFWTAFNYDADTLAVLMNSLTDYYMSLFPATPLWCSVDYVKFEFSASGNPVNHLASLYTSYGIANYPNRFGLFREDLSGCNPQPAINPGSHWFIMQQNPCRTGAQMLWNVQDGPQRMNQCGMVPNTKSFVLDSAVQHGITLGMRYLEIYGADISDTSLTANIATANTDLLAKASQCNGSTGIHSNVTWNAGIAVYPNPVADRLTVILPPGFFNLVLCDLTGRILFEKEHISEKQEIMVSELIDGVYLLKADDRKNRYYQKIFVCK